MLTNKEKKKQKKKSKLATKILDVFLILLAAGATYATFKLTNVKPENQEINNPSVISDISDDEPEVEAPEKPSVDLQPVIDSWASTLRGANLGVLIIDLDEEEVVGTLNANEIFSTASVYKIFPTYEGYRRISTGLWDKDEVIYDGMSIEKCLDEAIRESHSGCAETLIAKIGSENLNYEILNSFGLENTNVRNLTSTPSDVAEMMRIFYDHKDFSEEYYSKFLDSMLNQPISDESMCGGGYCNWRQGFPKGFTRGTNVYNKVGWEYNGAFWVVYNDAGILEFPEKNRHFAYAVMTANLSSAETLVKLGDMIEEAILAYLEME